MNRGIVAACWGIGIILFVALFFVFNRDSVPRTTVAETPSALSTPEAPPTAASSQPDTPSEGSPEETIDDPPLAFGSTVTGRVYDVATDEGIEGVTIAAGSTAGYRESVITDKSGQYKFTQVPLGRVTLQPNPWDTKSPLPGSTYQRKSFAIVEEGELVGPDFPVDYGITFSGRVQDQSGNPLENVLLYLASEFIPVNRYRLSVVRVSNTYSLIRAVSDHDGEFRMVGLSAESDMKLMAVKRGYARQIDSPIHLYENGQSDYVVTLMPESSISGIVVDRDERPVARVNVLAVNEQGVVMAASQYPGTISRQILPPPPLDANGHSPWYRGAPKVQIDAFQAKTDGLFFLPVLPQGTYRLFAHQEANKWEKDMDTSSFDEREAHATLTIGAGEKIENVKLQLDIVQPAIPELGEDTLTFTGHVTDKEGHPIPNSVISLDSHWKTLSDAQGAYSLTVPYDPVEILKVKQYGHGGLKLSASATGYNSGKKGQLTSDAESVDFILYKDVQVSGRVVDAITHEPIQVFSWNYISHDPSYLIPNMYGAKQLITTTGEFSLQSHTQNRLALLIMANGYCPIVLPLAIENQDISDLKIELQPSATIQGRVLSALGEPIDNAAIFLGVKLEGQKSYESQVEYTDPSGIFILTSIPKNINRILVKHKEHGDVRVEVDMTTATKHHLTIRMNPKGEDILSEGALIEGTLYYNGQPMPNQSVDLAWSKNQETQNLRTDANGRYRIGGLQAGEAKIEARIQLKGSGIVDLQRWFSLTVEDMEQKKYDIHFDDFNTKVYGKITLDTEVPSDIEAIIFSGNRRELGSAYARLDVDSKGHFSLSGLPTGSGTLRISVNDVKTQLGFELTEGQPVELNVDLSASATVHGTVQGEGEFRYARVYCYEGALTERQLSNAHYTAEISLHESGPYQITLPKAGTYTIATHAQYGDSSGYAKYLLEVITVEEKDVVELNFEF